MRASRPIAGSEIYTPKVWGRRKKFDSDTLAFRHGIAKIDDAAFLFLLGEGIGEDEHGVHGDRLIQVQQTAVGIDDDRLAGFAESAPV